MSRKLPYIVVAHGAEAEFALRYLEGKQADGAVLIQPVWPQQNFDAEMIKKNTGGRIKFLFAESNRLDAVRFYDAFGLPITVVEGVRGQVSERNFRAATRELRQEILESRPAYQEARAAALERMY